jgi:hypothetical protein
MVFVEGVQVRFDGVVDLKVPGNERRLFGSLMLSTMRLATVKRQAQNIMAVNEPLLPDRVISGG